eukprot:COSAG05_NODE_7225_length_841_cov_0.618598_1_plen_92_part_10
MDARIRALEEREAGLVSALRMAVAALDGRAAAGIPAKLTELPAAAPPLPPNAKSPSCAAQSPPPPPPPPPVDEKARARLAAMAITGELRAVF